MSLVGGGGDDARMPATAAGGSGTAAGCLALDLPNDSVRTSAQEAAAEQALAMTEPMAVPDQTPLVSAPIVLSVLAGTQHTFAVWQIAERRA